MDSQVADYTTNCCDDKTNKSSDTVFVTCNNTANTAKSTIVEHVSDIITDDDERDTI